jgi:3-isopropylmalate/(R)-2-methylmalate dehydratase small subunit
VPLDRADVDTDQIIPAQWMKRVERTGFGAGLFEAWRGPGFPLDDPRFAGAVVLVTGPNFGIGSSREHAVWALTDAGFEAVVAPRFGDIFRANAARNGLVCVEVEPATGRRLLDAVAADPSVEFVVDVADRRLTAPGAGVDVAFPLDDGTRRRLLEGLDDVAVTMASADAIAAHEAGRPPWMPSLA